MESKTGNLSSHSRSDVVPCMPWASHLAPLAPSLVSSAKSRMGCHSSCSLLLGLAFSQWVQLPREMVYLESEWEWGPLCTYEQSRTIAVPLICLIYYFISENVQKTQFLLMKSKQKSKLEWDLCSVDFQLQMVKHSEIAGRATLRELPLLPTHLNWVRFLQQVSFLCLW